MHRTWLGREAGLGTGQPEGCRAGVGQAWPEDSASVAGSCLLGGGWVSSGLGRKLEEGMVVKVLTATYHIEEMKTEPPGKLLVWPGSGHPAPGRQHLSGRGRVGDGRGLPWTPLGWTAREIPALGPTSISRAEPEVSSGRGEAIPPEGGTGHLGPLARRKGPGSLAEFSQLQSPLLTVAWK